MKKYTLSVFCFLAITLSKAQLPSLAWAINSKGTSNANNTSLAVDDLGNVYSAGYFSGTTDFDPGASTFNLTSAGNTDIYILKLDKLGKFIWAIRMGGPSNDKGLGIALDKSGNVYTTGYFTTTADFDPGAGTHNLTAIDSTDIFISKLDASGNFVWAKCIGGKSGEEANSIAIDGYGSVYTTGYFKNVCDFNPADNATCYLSSTAGSEDIFISKLDGSGNFISAVNFIGAKEDRGTFIAIDKDNNVYTTGTIGGDVNFVPNGCYHLIPGGNTATFILKHNKSGDLVWLSESGGPNDIGKSLTVDPEGNVYFMSLSNNLSNFNISIIKLNSAGSGFWLRTIGNQSSSHIEGNSIVSDVFGNLYITGRFQGTVDFDPWKTHFTLTANENHDDIFILKLDTYGNFKWARKIGGNLDDWGNSIVADPTGNLYIAGSFSDIVDFDPDLDVRNLDAGDQMDIFVLKMGQKSVSGIEDLSYSKNIQIYPNPSNGLLNISILQQGNGVSIELYNDVGILVYQQTGLNENNTIDLSDLANGLYVVRVMNEAGLIGTQKIILE